MGNELGVMTQEGFVPSAPGVESLMDMLGRKAGGWDEMNNAPAGQAAVKAGSAREDLLKCYAQVYATPAGKKVVEDILNMTLRRASYMPVDRNKPMPSLEQQTAYGLERKGQDGLATLIISKIWQGQNLKSPPKKKTKKS